MNIRNFTNQSGFTLVEVLVALIILSIGLLGVAGMQISGMKGNHNAFLRSQAQQYAYEMLDMMRANRTAAISPTNTINYSIAAIPLRNAAGNDFLDPTFGGKTNVALSDLQEWGRGVIGLSNQSSSLPGGQGLIVVAPIDEDGDGTTDTWLVTITVSWTEGRLADDAAPFVTVETKL